MGLGRLSVGSWESGPECGGEKWERRDGVDRRDSPSPRMCICAEAEETSMPSRLTTHRPFSRAGETGR